MKNESGKSVILVILIIALIVGVGAALYIWYDHQENSNVNPNAINGKQTEAENRQSPEKDDKIYEEIKDALPGIQGLYITNIEEKGDKYVIRGVIYDTYTLTEKELEELKNGGSIAIEGQYDIVIYTFIERTEEYAIEHSASADAIGFLVQDLDDDPYFEIVPAKDAHNSGKYELTRSAQLQNVWKLTTKYMEIEIDSNTKYIPDITSYDEESTVKDLYDSFTYEEPRDFTRPRPLFNFTFNDGKCVEMYRIVTAI